MTRTARIRAMIQTMEQIDTLLEEFDDHEGHVIDSIEHDDSITDEQREAAMQRVGVCCLWETVQKTIMNLRRALSMPGIKGK